jgi:hypothetical protein
MTLHAHLAQLVAARGSDVLGDPGEFRAALDDYLTDNVLVDAVRLGAVRRLLDLLDQGSDPRAAVNEAGLALARERGSDDARRSLRATAQLGYAAGRLDDDVVQDFDVAMPQEPFPPPPIVPAPVPAPPGPSPAASTPTRVVTPAGTPESTRSHRGPRRSVLLTAGGGALLLVLVGAALWWFVLRGEAPEDAVDDFFAARSCEEAAALTTGTAADQIQTEIDRGNDSRLCPAYADFSFDYDVTSSDERGDRATIEVEGTQHYDGSDESVEDQQDFSATFDLRRIEGEWLISNINWPDLEQ